MFNDNYCSFSSFNTYIGMIQSIKSDDPYEFWAANKDSLRSLSIVAKQILSAPATSSSCERCFSFAGIFTELRRSKLSSSSLNAKLILAANKGIIHQLDPIK